MCLVSRLDVSRLKTVSKHGFCVLVLALSHHLYGLSSLVSPVSMCCHVSSLMTVP